MAAKVGPTTQTKGVSRQVNKGAGGVRLFEYSSLSAEKRRKTPLIILGVLLLISIGIELFAGLSGCALLRKTFVWMDPFFVVLSPFFCAASVLKVAETIGVCSILVAWIYAALDKTELGIRYGELVRRELLGYHGYVAVHFVSVLLCLWLSKAGMTESAVLALCGVLYASLLQWKVLHGVILSSEHRRGLALGVWDSRVEAAQNSEEVKAIALDMIDVITERGAAEAAPLLEKLVSVVLEYGQRCRTEHGIDGLELAVEDVAWFWGRLLQGTEKSERIYMARDLFSCCGGNGCDYGVICAGYVLWQLNDAIMRGNQTGKTEEETLSELLNTLSITVRGKLERNMPWLLKDLLMVFVFIAYQYFFRRPNESIPLRLLSVWNKQSPPCPMRDCELLHAVSGFYFNGPIEPYFLKTIQRMWGHRTRQGVGR